MPSDAAVSASAKALPHRIEHYSFGGIGITNSVAMPRHAVSMDGLYVRSSTTATRSYVTEKVEVARGTAM